MKKTGIHLIDEKSIAEKRLRLLLKEAKSEPEITGFPVFVVKTNDNL